MADGTLWCTSWSLQRWIIEVTALLFALRLKIMGTKTLHHEHHQLLIDAASSFNTKTILATQYFPCEADISRSYQQQFSRHNEKQQQSKILCAVSQDRFVSKSEPSFLWERAC
jgi:hypothetical protein